MFGLLRRVGEAVGEVVAPTYSSPLEDMRYNWKSIKQFYLDSEGNKVTSVLNLIGPLIDGLICICLSFTKEYHDGQGDFHDRLAAIVKLVLEEEDNESGEIGPCLEFFLHNKILESLCAVCEVILILIVTIQISIQSCIKQFDVNTRKLLLTTIAALIKNAKQPLLHHEAVHKPLNQLMKTLNFAAFPEHTQYLSLIGAIVHKLKQEPFLLEFFAQERECLVLSGLLTVALGGSDSAESAERLLLSCFEGFFSTPTPILFHFFDSTNKVLLETTSQPL